MKGVCGGKEREVMKEYGCLEGSELGGTQSFYRGSPHVWFLLPLGAG